VRSIIIIKRCEIVKRRIASGVKRLKEAGILEEK
jgi:hypothetical protein